MVNLPRVKRNPNLRIRSVCLHVNTLAKCEEIINNRLIGGVSNRSGLVEYALRKVFDEVFKEQSSTRKFYGIRGKINE